jgi:IS30 family transposase
LIIGKDQGSAIGTLVERQTRMVRLLHMPCRDGLTLHDALEARLADLPPALLRSITWDQGTEMARHLTITKSLGAPVYFCDSHSPWQRGSNENMNGLLRDYFPKGTDLSAHLPQHLLAVEDELNNRPRCILGDRAPAELWQEAAARRIVTPAPATIRWRWATEEVATPACRGGQTPNAWDRATTLARARRSRATARIGSSGPLAR